MTVGELIEKLNEYDSEMPVWFDVNGGEYYWAMERDNIRVRAAGEYTRNANPVLVLGA